MQRRIRFVLVVCAFGIAGTASAQGIADFLDAVDLNEYSLAFNFYASESPYAGVSPFQIIYPIPSSFDHAINSDYTYFYRDGHFGLRQVSASGWSAGIVANIQTLGHAAGDSEALDGMLRRAWSIQAGGTVGKRFGLWSIDLFSSWDILDEFDGNETELKLARLIDGGRWQLAPQLDATYQSANLVNHYFGVEDFEARPGRPAYQPGGAVTYAASIDLSYRFHPHWYATFFAAVDWLPDEIRNSPIVDKEMTWRISLGVAYDTAAFLSLEAEAEPQATFFDVELGSFFVSTQSKVNVFEPAPPGNVIENVDRLDDTTFEWPVKVGWQAGRFHRVDLRYFELDRSGVSTATFPIDIGGVTFPANQPINTKLRTRTVRIAYSFALFRDPQKELAILGGISATELSYRVSNDANEVFAETTSTLPVIGATGRVNFTEDISLDASLEIFALDVADRSGELVDLVIAGNYRVTPGFFVGLGYRLFRQDIQTGDDDFIGEYRVNYYGPLAYVRMHF